MSKIYLKSEPIEHFLMDSKGDLYQVSEELAESHALLHPGQMVTVNHIDKETNTIWFNSPLPPQVKVEESNA